MAHITESIAFDRRLALSKEQYYRRMAFGDQWSKIRIGVRLSINGRNSIAVARLTVGVCTDDTSGFESLRSNGFYGVSFGYNQNITYNSAQANTSFFLQSTTNEVAKASKIGLVATSTQITHATVGFTATPNVPGAIYICLSRTAATGVFNFTDVITPTTAALTQPGRSVENFLRDMENEANVPALGLTRVTPPSGNYVATSSLPFPYICVGWSKCTPTVEITHIAVTKFN